MDRREVSPLSAAWKRVLLRAVTSVLLSCGLALPLLGVLDVLTHWPTAVLLCCGVSLWISLGELRRRLPVVLWGASLSVCAVWLITGGSAAVFATMRAVVLHLSGIRTAVPLIAAQAVPVIVLLLALVSAACTGERPKIVTASVLLLIVLLLLWLQNRPELLPLCVPALAAVLAISVLGTQRGLSAARVLPLMLVISLLAAAIVPADGVTVAPLKDAADRLRQRVLDHLFFTAPRNVFSLANEGYYPQGIGQMGGPAEPTNHPVMEVKSAGPVYLRGVVKNQYTGRTWLDTTGGSRYLWISPRWNAQRSSMFNMQLPGGTLGEAELMTPQLVSVTLADGSASNLFVPQRIRGLTPGGDLVVYFNNASELFVTRDLRAGDSYSVSAPLPAAGEAGLETLVNACARRADDSAYAEIVRTYTALPDHLQSQIFDFARQAAGSADSPYARALNIQNWLRRNYLYRLDVPEQDSQVDFVSSFLLTQQSGYCVHFASALTVLCRMVGIPARYVEGYLAVPGSDGVAHVTGLDAHAWTEVYLEGFGWLTFDATPSRNNSSGESGASAPPSGNAPTPSPEPQATPTPPPQENSAQNEPPPEGAATPSPEPEDQPETAQAEDETPPDPPDGSEGDADKQGEDVPPAPTASLWLWLLLLLIAIALVLRWRMTRPARLAAREESAFGQWTVWMQAVSDALSAMQLQRKATETPTEWLSRAEGALDGALPLSQLGQCASLVHYGRAEPLPGEIEATGKIYAALLHRLNPLQRVKLLLSQLFVPISRRDYAGHSVRREGRSV